MLCDSCQKRRVCKHTEQCKMLESNIMQGHIEEIFSLKITCKEYMSDTGNILTKSCTTTHTPMLGVNG